MATNRIFEQIAREVFRLDTLETRHSDSLDFHDVAVWQIEEALRRAFEAGKAAKVTSKPA